MERREDEDELAYLNRLLTIPDVPNARLAAATEAVQARRAGNNKVYSVFDLYLMGII